MNTLVDVESGPVGHGPDIVVVTPDATQSLPTPTWDKGDNNPSSGGGAGLMVTKLLTRPKTSSSAQRQSSVQYVYGSKCSIQVLGEKLSQPQAYPQERPKTSVARARRKERPGTSVKDRSGFVAVQAKELPLPICSTRNIRAPPPDKEIFSITTKLRNRSAVGVRNIASLLGPTTRDRSAALLKELSLSLSLSSSSKVGPTSPFKDCLREKWNSISKDNSVFTGPTKDRPLTPFRNVQEINDETASIPSVDGSQGSGSKALPTERSRALSYFKDLRETWNMSYSTSKDSGDLTRRSSSPVKDSASRSRSRASTKRTQSTGNVLLNSGSSGNDTHRSLKKEISSREVMMTSPRIITINRIPSASSKKESRTKSREKVDSAVKPIPKATLPVPGATPSQGSEDLLPPPSLHSSRDHHSSKETLLDSSLQGEAPCKVTSFEMAISSPVKDSLIRSRAASLLPDAGQPVSVREDTVLTLCALYGDQPPSVKPHAKDTNNVNAAPSQAKKVTETTAEENTRQSQKNNASNSHEKSKEVVPDHCSGTSSDDIVKTSQTNHTKAAQKEHENPSQEKVVPRISQEALTAMMQVKLDSALEKMGGTSAAGKGRIVAKPLRSPRQASDEAEAKEEVVTVLPAESGVQKKTIRIPLRSASTSSDSSSSTPTVPFSNSDLLYGNGEGAGRAHQGGHGGSEDVAAGDVGAWEHRSNDKQKLKELDLHGNRRPASRNSSNRKVPNFDKVAFDRDREELRPIANSLPNAKQSPLRANGIKNNLLRADQFLGQRPNGSAGRDEDLVAMGTLWSPSQLQTRGSSTTTSSGKSTSAPNSGGGGGTYTSSSTLPVRRPINLSTSTSTRQLLHHSTGSSVPTGNMGNFVRPTKEVEPKYSDPLSGATPTFQQRLMELAALEGETVRWERTKKVKKKPKQDRDS